MLLFLHWCCYSSHVDARVFFSLTFYCCFFCVGVVVIIGVVMDANIKHHLPMDGIYP
jgi:hypothetical protein